jgi:pimeloyl-ACP methyl ester carboxylesterase
MAEKPIYKSETGRQLLMDIYDRVLARWPEPNRMLNIPTRHGDTFVVANGSENAAPLILLHGAGSNSATWFADVVSYAPHFRVYAVDLTGEPGRSAPNRSPWTGTAYVEWFDDLLEALAIEKAAVLGYSLGGWIALKYAVSRPQRIDKLVLLSPGGIVADKPSFFLRAIPLSFLGERGAKRIKRLVFGNQEISEEADRFTTLSLVHFRSRLGKLPIFSDEALRSLTMPTLLLGGAVDAIRDVERISLRMQKLLPQMKTVIIPGIGHLLIAMTPYVIPFLLEGDGARVE